MPRPQGLIIGSLTTTPVRINETIKTILDLLTQQTLPLDELILNVPMRSIRFNSSYDVPANLLQLQQPRLTILRGSDYGPATKLVPVLQLLRQRGLAPENVTLVVVDDDTDYNPNLICEYARAELRYPGAALGCTAAAS